MAVFSPSEFSGLKLSLCLMVLSKGLEHWQWGGGGSPWFPGAWLPHPCGDSRLPWRLSSVARVRSSGEGARAALSTCAWYRASDLFTSFMGFNCVSLNDFHVYVYICVCVYLIASKTFKVFIGNNDLCAKILTE